jgi:hypothetical protein
VEKVLTSVDWLDQQLSTPPLVIAFVSSQDGYYVGW